MKVVSLSEFISLLQVLQKAGDPLAGAKGVA